MTWSHRNVKGFFSLRIFLKMYFQIYSYQKLIIVMSYSHLNSSFSLSKVIYLVIYLSFSLLHRLWTHARWPYCLQSLVMLWPVIWVRSYQPCWRQSKDALELNMRKRYVNTCARGRAWPKRTWINHQRTRPSLRNDVHTLGTPTKDQNWPTNPVILKKSKMNYFRVFSLKTHHCRIQLFRERLSEKMCTRQSRKVIWDMINTLFLTL